jgi:hypothetical protein
LGEPDVRADPYPDDHRVGVDGGAVGEPYATGPSALGEDLGDLGALPHLDAVIAVQTVEDVGHLPAEDAQQR